MEEEKNEQEFNDQEVDGFSQEEQTQENQSDLLPEEPKGSPIKLVIAGVLVILAIIVSAVIVIFMLNTTGDRNDEENTDNGTEAVEDPEGTIYFGVLPLQNPTEMLNRFGALETYLNENTDMNIKMRFYPTEGELGGFSAVVKDFINDEIGFVFLAPVTTIQAYGNIGDQMEVLACGERYDGSATYQGDLLVREDSSYQSVWDLEGEPVAGTSISSTSGNLMPSAMLIEEGIDAETFFVSIDEDKEGGLSYLGSHDKAVEALLSGLVEGAFVNEQTMYKFLEDGADVRSIWRHDPVPEFPISANKNVVTDEQIEQFYEAVLENEDMDSKVYTRMDADYNRFVNVSIDDYLPVKKAIDAVHGETFYDLERWGKDEEDEEDVNEEEEE